MDKGPDFLVLSANNQPAVAVEVKAHRQADDVWADRFWRNLVTHSVVPSSTSFLLVLPEYLYYWQVSPSGETPTTPQKASTHEALAPYLGAHAPRELAEPTLELAVKSWLSDLISSGSVPSSSSTGRWASQSGLYDKIRGGRIKQDWP
jgi:hypothetical protein